MSNANVIYSQLIEKVMASPVTVTSRGETTRREICLSAVFDSFPLVTTRHTSWKYALLEWEWFMSGSFDINDLCQKVRHWWTPWANGKGIIPYNYGQQFRRSTHYAYGDQWEHPYGQFDQIAWLVEAVKTHPFSRRNVITTWNTGEMAQPDCPITNCHGTVIQVFGRYQHGETPQPHTNSPVVVDMVMYQRSCDLILGVPHNWVQYWAFLLWLANRTGTKPGKFYWQGGDVHVYEKHYGVANEIVANTVRNHKPDLIHWSYGGDFKADDFRTNGVFPPAVHAKVEMVVGERK